VANWYCCALLALHAYCWITVPLVVPAARASRHLLLFLLMTEYQVAGLIGPAGGVDVGGAEVGGVLVGGVLLCPASQRRPWISHLFCCALAKVDEVRVLFE
jgi:hypothetical protein